MRTAANISHIHLYPLLLCLSEGGAQFLHTQMEQKRGETGEGKEIVLVELRTGSVVTETLMH